MTTLVERRCVPCEGGVQPLDLAAATKLREQLRPAWSLSDGGRKLEATFEFKNYLRTVSFVNAVAWIAIREDHHPDLAFDIKTCRVTYWTHAIGGLSDNDFICAAKIDALLD